MYQLHIILGNIDFNDFGIFFEHVHTFPCSYLFIVVFPLKFENVLECKWANGQFLKCLNTKSFMDRQEFKLLPPFLKRLAIFSLSQ